MTEYAAQRNPDRRPTHPGAVLAQVLDAAKKSKTEIAARLCISRQHLHDILEQRKPVSVVMAARLGELFGNSGELWIRMQVTRDLWDAKRDPELKKVRPLERV